MKVSAINLTTALNGCVVEDENTVCIVNAQSIDPKTGVVITGNVQVQKKSTSEDGKVSTSYAGNYNISDMGKPSASAEIGTLAEIETAALAALEAVKAEITK